MATAPQYAAAPHNMIGLVPAALDASFAAPSNVTTLGSAGISGTKISQIDVEPVGTVVAGLVNIFLYDGTAYHLLESVTITAAAVSTTVPPVKIPYAYDNLTLPAGWSLRVTTTIAGNVSLVQVAAYGADF